tara:strand:- start:1241 stop:1615 length:375 start_codon:yes stop_codon:yes gene_type:complete
MHGLSGLLKAPPVTPGSKLMGVNGPSEIPQAVKEYFQSHCSAQQWHMTVDAYNALNHVLNPRGKNALSMLLKKTPTQMQHLKGHYLSCSNMTSFVNNLTSDYFDTTMLKNTDAVKKLKSALMQN